MAAARNILASLGATMAPGKTRQLLLVVATAALGLAAIVGADAARTNLKPNLVLLVVDDMG